MNGFLAALQREKMIFADPSAESADAAVTVRSNRLAIQIEGGEAIVIRAQSMHLTLLLASRAMASYFKDGPYAGRARPYDWEKQWNALLSNYERKYNPEAWAAVYIDGTAVFRTKRDPYLDVVEKCARLKADCYELSLNIAEKALKGVGRNIDLQQTSTAAAIFTDRNDEMECGIIHRGKEKTTTFSFTAAGGHPERRIVQSMVTAAAFLEALNLRFIATGIQNKLWMQEIAQASPEGFRLRGALVRIVALNKWIDAFEKEYSVAYRPQKPELFINV